MNFFKTLQFFPKNAFGLDISDASIEAMAVQNKLGKLSVISYGRREIPSGIVENGRILKPEELEIVLEDLIKELKPKSKEVILSVPESKTFIHIFRLPAIISEQNIGESVQYEAEETIPIAFNQAYHDYQVINKDKDYQEVLYVACLKEVVEEYRQVLTQVGLNPIIFEAESISIARALVKDDLPGATLIADLGARTTNLTIYSRGSIRYTDSLKVGGNAFTEIITQAMNISTPEAEKLKRTIGLNNEKGGEKFYASLLPLVQRISRAMGQAIEYYQKISSLKVERVILCGGASLTPGLEGYLGNQLPINVKIGGPLATQQFNQSKIPKLPAVLFATVIGLAKRGMSRSAVTDGINLLAHEKQHHHFLAIKDLLHKSEKSQELSGKPFITAGKINKRMAALLIVFALLITVFLVIFFTQKGKNSSLIQFQNINYSPAPVNN